MPVIIISGQPGAGSSTAAKLLAKELGFAHWSAGDYAKQFGKSEHETERAIEAWKGAASKKQFHLNLDKAVQERAKQGDVVIDGKLAIHFAKNFATLTVWLKCPHTVRAQRLAQRDKIPLAEADRILDEKERLERTKWQQMYGLDPWEQEAEADLVLDTSALKPEQVVEKIKAELEKKRPI
ncbi:MAG: cytidylate kinase family protein [Candidatus Aenigmatarchaeota archaeon]